MIRVVVSASTPAEIWVHRDWRCICGAKIRAFDFDVSPSELTHTCSQCHGRMLVIELSPPATGEP